MDQQTAVQQAAQDKLQAVQNLAAAAAAAQRGVTSSVQAVSKTSKDLGLSLIREIGQQQGVQHPTAEAAGSQQQPL